MSRYRATDEQLDREIAVVRTLVRVRYRRAMADLRELDQALRELKQERRRRQVVLEPIAAPAEEAAATA